MVKDSPTLVCPPGWPQLEQTPGVLSPQQLPQASSLAHSCQSAFLLLMQSVPPRLMGWGEGYRF